MDLAHSMFVRAGFRYCQWSACHHQMSLRAGTGFDNSKLVLPHRFLAIYVLSQSRACRVASKPVPATFLAPACADSREPRWRGNGGQVVVEVLSEDMVCDPR